MLDGAHLPLVPSHSNAHMGSWKGCAMPGMPQLLRRGTWVDGQRLERVVAIRLGVLLANFGEQVPGIGERGSGVCETIVSRPCTVKVAAARTRREALRVATCRPAEGGLSRLKLWLPWRQTCAS